MCTGSLVASLVLWSSLLRIRGGHPCRCLAQTGSSFGWLAHVAGCLRVWWPASQLASPCPGAGGCFWAWWPSCCLDLCVSRDERLGGPLYPGVDRRASVGVPRRTGLAACYLLAVTWWFVVRLLSRTVMLRENGCFRVWWPAGHPLHSSPRLLGLWFLARWTVVHLLDPIFLTWGDGTFGLLNQASETLVPSVALVCWVVENYLC